MDTKRKIKKSTVIISVIILLILSLAGSSFWVYKFGINSEYAKSASNLIPLPVVIVNGDSVVFYKDFFNNIDSVKSFYKNQDFGSVGIRIDFSTEEGRRKFRVKERDVLNKMIEDDLIRDLAEERGIKISSKVAEESVERKLQEIGFRENIKENLKKLYGWTLKDFEERVVLPSIYAEKLKEFIENDSLNEINLGLKGEMESGCGEIKTGSEFDEVALEYANSGDDERNGDLGWFKKDQLSEDLASSIFELSIGGVSDVIESEVGFHVIMLKDKKSESGSELVKISQIFVQKRTFADWIEDEIG
ncbi:peptidylprolyl isomerase, partial [Patescibacteria group bacterium]